MDSIQITVEHERQLATSLVCVSWCDHLQVVSQPGGEEVLQVPCDKELLGQYGVHPGLREDLEAGEVGSREPRWGVAKPGC